MRIKAIMLMVVVLALANVVQAADVETGLVGGEDAQREITLTEFDEGYRDAVAELEENNLIPTGGKLLFQEDYAFFQGSGNWFTPLSPRSQVQNVVVAGTIEFRSAAPSDDFELCSLMSRIQASNRGATETFLQVSFVNDGTLVVLDVEKGEFLAAEVFQVDLEWATNETHHLLYIAIDDELTVFVDGKEAVRDMAVEARQGSFGVALLGRHGNSRCESTDMWVYNLD